MISITIDFSFADAAEKIATVKRIITISPDTVDYFAINDVGVYYFDKYELSDGGIWFYKDHSLLSYINIDHIEKIDLCIAKKDNNSDNERE